MDWLSDHTFGMTGCCDMLVVKTVGSRDTLFDGFGCRGCCRPKFLLYVFLFVLNVQRSLLAMLVMENNV